MARVHGGKLYRATGCANMLRQIVPAGTRRAHVGAAHDQHFSTRLHLRCHPLPQRCTVPLRGMRVGCVDLRQRHTVLLQCGYRAGAGSPMPCVAIYY